MYDQYARLIYEWLQQSGLTDLRAINSTGFSDVYNRMLELETKLDGLSELLQQLIVYAQRGLKYSLFFGLLWFVMHFVQKRWYTQ